MPRPSSHAAPLALIVLPILLTVVYLSLKRNEQNESEGSLLDRFNVPVSIGRFLSLLALPLASIAVYAAALLLDLRWHTNWVLYLITTPLGFILFGISLYQLWHRQRLGRPNAG